MQGITYSVVVTGLLRGEGLEDIKTPYLLAEQARAKGVNVTDGKQCEKCRVTGAVYYYTRPTKTGVRLNGCIWCAHLNGKTPPAVKADVTEVKPDGTAVYVGKACRVCGCRDHLTQPAHGQKAGKCYLCAVTAASEKVGAYQISRLRQQVKKETNKFIIQCIENSGTVEVAPRDLSEYYAVRALMEDRDRLNAIALDGVRYQIGHKFPTSGGGTEFRGKATVNNLCLIEERLNRSMGDNLPINWTVSQVVRVGAVYANNMTGREAAAAWRKRMGWDDITPTQKAQQKATEATENAAFKERLTALAGELAGVEGLQIAADTEFDQLKAKVDKRLSLIKKRSASIIKQARKERRSVYTVAGGLTEEALHGLNARYVVISNTLNQLLEVIHKAGEAIRNDPFNEQPNAEETERSYCIFLSEMDVIKRAFCMWAGDMLKNATYEIQGFTHPHLSQLQEAFTWGTRKGADGKIWLCGWMVDPRTNELQEQPIEQAALWVSASRKEWEANQHTRKNAVKDQLLSLVAMGVKWVADGVEISKNIEINTDDIYDEHDAEQHRRITRRLMVEAAEKRITNLNRKRDRLNTWWKRAQFASASDVERQAVEFYADFEDYRQPPRKGEVNPYDYTQAYSTATQEAVF